MKDIYLQSKTYETLFEDLKDFYPDFICKDYEGKEMLSNGNEKFSLDYCGVLAIPGTGVFTIDGKEIEPFQFYEGVHCNIRLNEGFESLFDSFEYENTKIINPKTPCRVFF